MMYVDVCAIAVAKYDLGMMDNRNCWFEYFLIVLIMCDSCFTLISHDLVELQMFEIPSVSFSIEKESICYDVRI